MVAATRSQSTPLKEKKSEITSLNNDTTTTTSKKVKLENFYRSKTDYIWIILLYLSLIYIGEYFWPNRTDKIDSSYIFETIEYLTNLIGIPGYFILPNYIELVTGSKYYGVFISFVIVTVISMNSITFALFYFINLHSSIDKNIFWNQYKTISINLILLPIYQTFVEMIVVSGYTKNTMSRADPLTMLLDACLWMLIFELSWYMQHRYCHDNKFLWTYGHSYHHTWNMPEHMIGVTNFAFDHMFEAFITMSSATAPIFIFPINWWAGKVISLAYMILAILAHFDGFKDYTSYHLNHHYAVTKNYGSHIPIFDILFGTYQWDVKVPRENRVASAKTK